MSRSKQEDIVILLKERIGNVAGLSRGNVTFLIDGDYLLEKSGNVIPGVSLKGPETLLRHEKGHFLYDTQVSGANRRAWVSAYDSKSKTFWESELTEQAGKNSVEGFAELFTLTTDQTYLENVWRFDPFVKQWGKRILGDIE